MKSIINFILRKKLLAYQIQFDVVSRDQTVESNCANMIFINKGSLGVKVNGFPLSTGDSFAGNGNFNELDITNYVVVFDSGLGSKLLYVMRKRYVAN